jgi:hypothetical protein
MAIFFISIHCLEFLNRFRLPADRYFLNYISNIKMSARLSTRSGSERKNNGKREEKRAKMRGKFNQCNTLQKERLRLKKNRREAADS